MACDSDGNIFSKVKLLPQQIKGLCSFQKDGRNDFMQLNTEISNCQTFTAICAKLLMVDVRRKTVCSWSRL